MLDVLFCLDYNVIILFPAIKMSLFCEFVHFTSLHVIHSYLVSSTISIPFHLLYLFFLKKKKKNSNNNCRWNHKYRSAWDIFFSSSSSVFPNFFFWFPFSHVIHLSHLMSLLLILYSSPIFLFFLFPFFFSLIMVFWFFIGKRKKTVHEKREKRLGFVLITNLSPTR